MTKSKPFAWFDLTRLRQDQSYPTCLSNQLGYAEADKLTLVLNDCAEILLAERDSIKDYKNNRKRHFNEEVLNNLPHLANKIKKLCLSYSIEACNRQVGFKGPSEDQQIITPNTFPLEIDLLDLIALHLINYLDEAFSQSADSNPNNTRVIQYVERAMFCRKILQEKILVSADQLKMSTALFTLAKDSRRLNQSEEGLISADVTRMKVVLDDLFIANIILALINLEDFKRIQWNSLNKLAEEFQPEINDCLDRYPLRNQTEISSVTLARLKRVIKEINHVAPELLIRNVNEKQIRACNRPIPTISNEESTWRHYKIQAKYSEELTLTILYTEYNDPTAFSNSLREYLAHHASRNYFPLPQ